MTQSDSAPTTERSRHILHRYRTVPFRMLPAPFGYTVPIDLRVFEAEAEEAQHIERPAPRQSSRVRHAHTRPARQDEALERQ